MTGDFKSLKEYMLALQRDHWSLESVPPKRHAFDVGAARGISTCC